MVSPGKSFGNFSVFLSTINQKGVISPSPESKFASRPNGTSSLDILRVLGSSESTQMSLADLRRACGMSIGEFGKAIESFESANLISLSGSVGEEVVHLTDTGAQVLKAA
jgi:DNA-binding MarR family transcriptional regulator